MQSKIRLERIQNDLKKRWNFTISVKDIEDYIEVTL